ncbi:MAG: hemolysin family protein [Clostridia bacterium]|nr:hemolysin family protein [Clostridia bacterium]
MPDPWIRSSIKNLIRKARKDRTDVTEEEIRQIVDIGEEAGAIEAAERDMIENIFEFNNRTAEDVMTHRTNVYYVSSDDDRDTILSLIRETGLSRFPVCGEDMDDIVGTLNARDYLLNCLESEPRPMKDLLREAYFVPETIQADALFRDMQKKKIHMAVVIDEYGGMSGIVTMEDLLEEIVGNIYDEFDPQAVADIEQVENGLWRISGKALLEDISEALGIALPSDEEFDTLGGLVFSQMSSIPQDGSTPEVEAAGLKIRVEKLEDHHVVSALVSKLPADSAETDDE